MNKLFFDLHAHSHARVFNALLYMFMVDQIKVSKRCLLPGVKWGAICRR
jgi:hypothetical protein